MHSQIVNLLLSNAETIWVHFLLHKLSNQIISSFRELCKHFLRSTNMMKSVINRSFEFFGATYVTFSFIKTIEYSFKGRAISMEDSFLSSICLVQFNTSFTSISVLISFNNMFFHFFIQKTTITGLNL